MKKNLKLVKYISAICLLSVLFMLTGCKEDSNNGKTPNKYTPDLETTSTISNDTKYPSVTTPPTTLPAPDFELPELIADNITIAAGESIDYIGNLTIKGADESDISEIIVNSASVRPQVPGVYSAIYTVNFRGYPVTKMIVVSVTAASDNTTPTFPGTPAGNSVGDMRITLSSGAECLIPCTTEHYIIESHTDDIYTTKDGKTYRTSILKATFSDGEVIEIETVHSRAIQ